MEFIRSTDGTRIAYDKTGDGPAVILVSGAFSYRRFPPLVQLAELLSKQFTVYNYDRRGRGESGDNGPYAIEREIEDLEAMIEEAGGSAYVWGLSSGAVLTLHAVAAGVGIEKLALHEPPFVVKPEDRKPPKDFAAHLTELIAKNQRSEAIKYFMTDGMGAPKSIVMMMRMMPKVWSKLMDVAHTLPYDATLLNGYMDGEPLPTENWGRIKVPTIVMEGTESPISLRNGAQALARVLPNAKLISKKGLGHSKQLNASMIATELTGFFG